MNFALYGNIAALILAALIFAGIYAIDYFCAAERDPWIDREE